MRRKKKKFKRFTSDFQVKEKFILRDFLAMERTTLANERTFFAYIRSGIYLILAGIAFFKLENLQTIHWIGYILFGISAFMFVFGIVRYQMLQRKIDRFYDAAHVEQEEKVLEKLADKKSRE